MNNTDTTQSRQVRFALAVFLGFLLIILLSIIFYSDSGRRGDIPSLSEERPNPFSEVILTAKAAYVYDIRDNKVLFAKNENVPLPLASLTKLMTSLVARELTPESSVITVNDQALESLGDTGLLRNEKWSLEDILGFSLLTSSNDGVRAVALSLGALSTAETSPAIAIGDFVKAMNLRADALGLENTYFLNETGLDESETEGGAYGTAEDTAILLEYLLLNHEELLAATREVRENFLSLDNHLHVATNTNTIAASIPGLLASKTGLTNIAGGNLAFVFDPELGRPTIVSILGSTEKGRFDDARILIQATMEYIKED